MSIIRSVKDHKSRIVSQETSRDFRTETPNIVFELLEVGEISNSDFILYSVYRRIAGQNGACWYGTRELAKKCGLSEKTITSSKKNLSKKFALLSGKKLIEIKACDRKKETADIVTVIDIWPENFLLFKKISSSDKARQDFANFKKKLRVVNKHTRVWEKRPHKKEPSKKEPIIIAPPLAPTEKAPPSKTESTDRSNNTPAGGNNNFFNCLEKCNDLSPKQKSMLLKYPEPLVEQAVRYCYHPTTQIKGGPIGRLKLMLYFVQNPENFKDKMQNLDSPEVKTDKKETLIGNFKHGSYYNGYEYTKDDIGVGFYKSGMMKPYSVNWDSPNFAAELLKILEKIGIKLE